MRPLPVKVFVTNFFFLFDFFLKKIEKIIKTKNNNKKLMNLNYFKLSASSAFFLAKQSLQVVVEIELSSCSARSLMALFEEETEFEP